MSQNTANDRIRQGGLQPDEVPEQSEGNRLIVRIASLAAANEQSGDTEQKQRQNWFCKMFLGCIKAILTVFGGTKNGAHDRLRTGDLFITSELLYQLSHIGALISLNIASFCSLVKCRAEIFIKNLTKTAKLFPSAKSFLFSAGRELENLPRDCILSHNPKFITGKSL